jgi:hypothetical protein
VRGPGPAPTPGVVLPPRFWTSRADLAHDLRRTCGFLVMQITFTSRQLTELDSQSRATSPAPWWLPEGRGVARIRRRPPCEPVSRPRSSC